MSPGVASEYSPSVGGGPSPPFFQFPTQHAWTDGSSMSSPTSTYDGSGFSSPTTAYPSFQPYQGQTHAPQDQSHQSYFAQRQPSFGSITPRLMMGSTGPNTGHPFDNRLETTLEHSLEGGEGGQPTSMYYQQGQGYDNSPSGQHSQVTPNQQGTPVDYVGYPYHRSSHSLPIAQTDANGSMTTGHPFVKIEEQDGIRGRRKEEGNPGQY
ncbi:hypothetical protein BG011_000628 [Mortierella polycephala]|uniref:Uncharacterized protein n=1 Tax=Mortierella polycephala TaxID=41804 RepID=A0A9P6PM28_9FUNG|nr:hypothetical protein BG011_000628 [Mortierella polycephala]